LSYHANSQKDKQINAW